MSRCEILEVDGQPVRVRLDGEMTAEDHAALTEVVRAAKKVLASMPLGPRDYACPACGVAAGEFCRNQDGRVTGIHPARRELVAS